MSSSSTCPDCVVSLTLTDKELYANILHTLPKLLPATHQRLRQRIRHYLAHGDESFVALREGGITCHGVASDSAAVLGSAWGRAEHSLIHGILADSYLWDEGRLVDKRLLIDDEDTSCRELVWRMHEGVSSAVDSSLWQGGGGGPNLDDLEQADPAEASKLRALLQMREEELDEWLSHGDLAFRTTTGEASVAPLIGGTTTDGRIATL